MQFNPFEIQDEKSMQKFMDNFKGMWFHVSGRQNLKQLKPSIPSKKNMESKKQRICVSDTLEGCLKGRFSTKNEILYVYVVEGTPDYKPKKSEVVDVLETNEHWFYNSLNCQMLGCVKLTKDWKTKTNWK